MTGLSTALLLTVVALLPADNEGYDVSGYISGDGSTVTLTEARAGAASRGGGAKGGAAKPPAGHNPGPAQPAAAKPAPEPPRYQHTWDYACPGAAPGSVETPLCGAAVMACTGATGGGPQIIIWRRQVSPATSGWQSLGTSCDPDAVPADTAPSTPAAPAPPRRPVLTMAMILDAFHRTQFTTPMTIVQPKGNATLIRLPVYLQASFPAAGYEPGEVAQIPAGQMLGYDVKIKPVLQSVTYDFGDGTTIGPTTDLGGPYPTGTVTHPYTRAGTFRQRTTITYGGEVSVNGGAYVPLTGTTTLTAPAQAITVKTASNQLIG